MIRVYRCPLACLSAARAAFAASEAAKGLYGLPTTGIADATSLGRLKGQVTMYGPFDDSPAAQKRLRRLRRAFNRISARYERAVTGHRRRLDWGLYVAVAVGSFALVWLWLDRAK